MKTELRQREEITPLDNHRVENASDPAQWPDAELTSSLKTIFPPIPDMAGTIKKLRIKDLYLLAPSVAKKPLSHLPPLSPKFGAPVAAAPASKVGGNGGGGQGNSSDPRVYIPTEQEEKELIRKIELSEKSPPRPFIAPPPTAPAPPPKTTWPPNRGFESLEKKTLQPGEVMDRFGSDSGTFTSPQGTPFSARSLPSNAATLPLKVYRVKKPLVVDSGPAIPWFGQSGGGIQYELPQTIRSLVASGYLEPI